MSESDYVLIFDATQAQPDFAKLFLTSGGAINTAAGAGATDFSVTCSKASTAASLTTMSTIVTVPIPTEMLLAEKTDETTRRITIDASAKLNYSSQRVGAAINGTLVDTNAGQGAVYLANFLRARGSHMQCPVVYGTLASYACTIGCSNMRIETTGGEEKGPEEVDVLFVENAEKQAVLATAEGLVDTWAHGAWAVREHIVYDLSPSLTKSVAKVPVGVNDKGYELVHNVLDQEFPFGLEALNDMFEHGTGMELQFDPDEIQQMKDATQRPGLRAAAWAQTVAAACSTIANYLVAYRADGRTVMNATGSAFENAESWLRTPMRTPCEANDCDGSGLVVTTILQTAINASAEDLEKHPYLRVVKNAVFPYYTFGISVVGATSAEASAGGGEQDQVAGHALALMVPTLSFLDGLDRAASGGHTVGGQPVSGDASKLRKVRFGAVFNEAVVKTLPEHEQEMINDCLATGAVPSWPHAKRLQPYAIEGTTPASPVLYVADSAARKNAAIDANLDQKAFEATSPNIGRSMKTLHVGGHKEEDPHRFYHDFVEITLNPSHPLYADANLRALGQGASQYVFGKAPKGIALASAGATPRELTLQEFVLAPLQRVDAESGYALDEAARVSKRDVVPARAGSMKLTSSQSNSMNRSIAALKNLNAGLSGESDVGHCIAFGFSFSTLVNNPVAVEHFVQRMKTASVGEGGAGVVDFKMVNGLAVDGEDPSKQMGHFVIANIVVDV